ncbi:sulfonate transport system substrate-binding protein [Roseiarcus fermentans]|uniref:Putative aliphatic sulfonates-binding protein n=1 Tax=Roseiarcus fermentans TaxID=1473586 RepID=A0A366F5C1_9HYPH|nr:aliphatic sulfonate ABC transporter substrate-binding protein [Roseiarcus fermentans]RBP09848.1 sulfonate transport system substrate-binding protein [Roseiarcus fermentans]
MNRRAFLSFSAALAAFGPRLASAEPIKELRIGYQKTGQLLVVKARKLVEQRFEPEGVSVRWIEFPSGPPLLEALNAGSIDYGYTGDAPPIFAQAAHAAIRYVGAIPARGYGQAILVQKDSPLHSLADLKGKKVAVAKGSSAHNLLVTALESAKIPWSDITPVYLAPADAASAFARGSVDAWSIWDPFFAIAELKQNARPLPIDPAATLQNSFFLANRAVLAAHPDVIAGVNADVAAATAWAAAHRDDVAELFAEASGVDLAAQQRAVARAEFTFSGVTDRVVAEQQAVADRFQRLGLIPAPIVVRDIVWDGKSSS